MKRKNTTRNMLFSSIVSLLLCVSMLVGTTFAWFTDSVVSGTNVIAAGNLDVELYHSMTDDFSAKNKVEGSTKLFTDEEGNEIKNWEPGVVAYTNLQVANEGNLALKYQMSVNFSNMNYVEYEDGSRYTLADALQVAVVDGGFTGGRAEALALDNLVPISNFVLSGELEGEETSETYGIVIYWESSENDNLFNINNEKTLSSGDALSVDLGINLFATQEVYEKDSFGDDYDENATVKYTTTANIDGSATITASVAPSVAENVTTVEAPAGAFGADDLVEIDISTENTLFDVSSSGAVVATLDVNMFVNGEETSADLDGTYYTVTTYISTGLSDVTVAYTGTDGKDQPINVNYDAETGKLTFQTNHFSEYSVSGKAYGYVGDEALDLEEVLAAVNADEEVEISVEDLKTVCNKLTTSDARNEFKKEYGIAAYGNNYYLTVEEFVEAFNTINGEIKLKRDISLDADDTLTVASGKTRTLNLNGYTLSGVTDQIGSNRNMFDVRGTLTIKNGTVTIEHVGDNMGWNNSTNVFNVTDGGVLKITDATVENMGGSDMAFCVHLNNWGEVTLEATNTVFKSNYVGVRAFNSGYDMNNITLKGCTFLTGSNCLWVHNYTAADFGNDADKVAAAAKRLNFSIKNTTFTRTNGSNSVVRFGFTDAIYYSDATMTEVVAGTEAAMNWAVANGKNVLLSDDLALGNTLVIPAGANIVLDLNGKVLSYESSTAAASCAIENKGNLTIKNGTVTYVGVGDTNYGYGTNSINNTGKLVIDGAVIKNTTNAGSSNAIDNAPGSVLIVEDGVIESEKVTIRLRDGSNVTINGGEISGARAVQIHLFQNVAADTKLTINDGKLTGDYALYSYAYGNVTFDRTTIDIAGGTFDGIVAFGGGNKNAKETVNITGGTFNGELGRYLANDGWEEIVKP